MKKYEIIKNTMEANDIRLFDGFCTIEQPNQVIMESFSSCPEALKALKKYCSSVEETDGHYLFTEYYVQENKYDEEGNRISGWFGDILENTPYISKCKEITEEEARKLFHYEKLEEKISWLFDGKLDLAMAVDQIQKSIEDETGENLAFSRILTNEEAEKWDKWLILEKQDRLLPLPCKLGSIVYKICPVCNDNHKDNCKHCAWCGCQPDGCDVGVGVYSDGSCNRETDLQVIPRRLWPTHLFTILKNWNTMYFATEEEAQKAIEEYDAIRFIEDRAERYENYVQWCKERETIYTYFEEE